MGLVQGLSEFLPISSSAHLVFTSNFYKIFKNIDPMANSSEEIFFNIMVHLGTLVAVLIFFRKDVMNILRAMVEALKTKNWDNVEAKLGLFIMIGTIVTVAVAFPINEVAEKLVFMPVVVGGLLFLTGFVLLGSEYMSKNFVVKKENVDLKTSILIGLAQGLAALPGFSRSGLTIATGLFFGLSRMNAARYSFLLSIPIILGASMMYPLIKIDLQEAMQYNWGAILAGTLTSMITGYICIKYFMKFISKFSLSIFGYYCILTGIVTVIFFSCC